MKEGIIIKQITKQEKEQLIKDGIIRNTCYGYVNSNNQCIGYYKTRGVAGKMYIEDYYADLVQTK